MGRGGKVQDTPVELPGFFAAAMEDHPRLVFVFGTDGRVVYANVAALRALGLARDASLGIDVGAIDPSLRQDVAPMPSTVEEARGRRSTFLRADGSSFPVDVSVSFMTFGEGRWAVAIAEDVSVRARHEQRASLLFSGSTIGVLFIDAQGTILEVNPACLEMFGFKPDEANRVVGTSAFDYMAPDEKTRAMANFSERVQENGNQRFRARMNRYAMVRVDGSHFICEVRATVIPDAQAGLATAAVFLADVTEFVRVQEHLRHAEKMEAVGQLAGGVSHDFNNQLTGILGFAEILRDRLLPSDPLRSYAEGIVAAAKRSAQLTGKLLSFSRKSVLQTSTVDVHAVLREVVSMLERSIDKRIRIVHPEHSDPCYLEVDAAQLQNVLLNLAINARDAMPEGGTLAFSLAVLELSGAECARISPRIAPGKYACLGIQDSGHGMNEEVQRHMFEPFFTTKPKGKGTGLGLASVWGIVKNHHGAIEVESAVGRGTLFRLFLPLSERNAVADLQSPLGAESKSLQILLVEDEPMVARVGREMLLRLGHGVDVAVDGIDAVELLCRDPGRYHVVLLDLVLPNLSGIEVFEAIRRIAPDLPIVLTSGLELDEANRRLLDGKKVGFVKKPFDIPSLGKAVSSMI